MNMTVETTRPNFEAIKSKQNAAWASGDYKRIGVTLQLVGEELAETMDLGYGATVLDVAAGNGNVTMACARRGARVTSTDYVDALLTGGRRRAEAEGLDVAFQLADAEALPFGIGQFDAVVSTYGVMFTPNQERAAAEMLRVTRRGGKIGLANWTPDGFVGMLFKTLGRYVPPPTGVQSPARWGTEDWVRQTFGGKATDIAITTKHFVFRYRSPEHFIEEFRNYYGPVHKAFLALDDDGKTALAQDLLGTIAMFNTDTSGGMRVPSKYLEVIVTKA